MGWVGWGRVGWGWVGLILSCFPPTYTVVVDRQLPPARVPITAVEPTYSGRITNNKQQQVVSIQNTKTTEITKKNNLIKNKITEITNVFLGMHYVTAVHQQAGIRMLHRCSNIEYIPQSLTTLSRSQACHTREAQNTLRFLGSSHAFVRLPKSCGEAARKDRMIQSYDTALA